MKYEAYLLFAALYSLKTVFFLLENYLFTSGCVQFAVSFMNNTMIFH